jgi:hypothetical protein
MTDLRPIPANGYAIIGNEMLRASVPLMKNGQEFKVIVDPKCPPDTIYLTDYSPWPEREEP